MALPIRDDEEHDDRARNSYVVPPRPTAIPETPVPPRRPAPVPQSAAAPQQATPAPRPAPQQAIPGAGDESSWLPPEEAERQNIAAHKELGKDYNPKRLVTTEFLPEIAKAVRTEVQNMFGIGGGGQAVPAERPNVAAYARAEGAPPRQVVEAARRAVDPNNELPPHLQTVAMYNGAYTFWHSQGQPEKANKAVAELALSAKRTLMQLGTLAEAAIAAGDKKALAQILVAANNETPDGTRLEAKPTKDGLDLSLFDINGNLTENGEAGMDMLLEFATGMQNGTMWLRSLGALEKRREVDPLDERRREVEVMKLDAEARKLKEEAGGPTADKLFEGMQRRYADAAGKQPLNETRAGDLLEVFEDDPNWEKFGAEDPQGRNSVRQLATMLLRGNPNISPDEAAAYATVMYYPDMGEDGKKEPKPAYTVDWQKGTIRIGNSPALNADPDFFRFTAQNMARKSQEQFDNRPLPPRPERGGAAGSGEERDPAVQAIIDRETRGGPAAGATTRRESRNNSDPVPLSAVPGIIGDAARSGAAAVGEAIGAPGPNERDQRRNDARERRRLQGQLRTLNSDLSVAEVRAMSLEQLRAEIERLGGER